MSKIKLLMDVVFDLRSLADSLQVVAETFRIIMLASELAKTLWEKTRANPLNDKKRG